MFDHSQDLTTAGPEGRPGVLLAKVLAGAWRRNPDCPDFSELEVSRILPQLYQSGDAALAWWRIRRSVLATTPTGAMLQDAYRHLRLRARLHEQEIKRVVSCLRVEGIEPVLLKGWAIAHRYPDPALRPYGDIDLCVRPDQFTRAAAVLKRLETLGGHSVDLHDGFAKLEGARQVLKVPALARAFAAGSGPPEVRAANMGHWQELFGRSRLVDLGGQEIRVLSDEDHLRVLCLHLLRSGAWRPLWLCDIALAIESATHSFDWALCLGTGRREAEGVACAIGLAQQLLGAESKFAFRNSQSEIPSWLVAAVLRQWDRCRNPDAAGMVLPTLLSGITPKKIFGELYSRWDNPVRATVATGGRFNNWPRLPYQLRELISRSPEIPRQLALMARRMGALRTASATRNLRVNA